MALPSYGKIYAVAHRLADGLFDGPVVIQEKVDGSQFSFGVDESGRLWCRSKGANIDPDNPPGMFAKSVETVLDAHARGALIPGAVYRGEAMYKSKHNTIAYDRVPKGNIALFDVEITPGTYAYADEIPSHADDISCEAVPVFYNGIVLDWEDHKSYLDRDSFLGGAKVEGVVVKNYAKPDPMDVTKYLKAKLVSEQFKEIHSGDWKERNPNKKDTLTKIVDMFATPARFEKAIQHLLEAGKLDNATSDIGPLMGEVNRDIGEEADDELVAALLMAFKQDILRGVASRVPTYYKEKLALAGSL